MRQGVRAWALRSWRELAPFAAVAAVAVVVRLVLLTKMPLHHDESEHAWFSWLLESGKGYHYDPVFHGPVQFYAMATADLLSGAGDGTARFATALVGGGLTALPFFLRRQLGFVAALATAVMLCVSPSFVYFSRFAREDIYAAFLTLALIAAVFRFLAHPRRWHPSLILGLLAVSFATKETTYIAVFIGGTFVVGAVAVHGVKARRAGRRFVASPVARAVASVGRDAWISGVATFFAVYTLLFTTFFTNPRGLEAGLVDSIRYWLSQQPVNRGGQPWFYYLVLIPAYEWPVVLLGLGGVVAVLRRPSLLGCFLVWFWVGSLVAYSWASERMPWLVLHPLLPLTLLAGIGAQELWRRRAHAVAKAALVATALAVVYTVSSAAHVTLVRPADPRELLVSVQTSTDVPRVRDEVIALAARQAPPRSRPRVEVDSWGGTGWPWAWYFRDQPVSYPDMSDADWTPTADVLVVADPNRALVQPRLHGYSGRRFRLRVWWVPDWGAASAGDWWRWLVWRRAWSPLGTLDEWLYVRRPERPTSGGESSSD